MMLTILSFMMVTVAVVTAGPPSQVGGPNCVYPSEADARCNLNERMDEARAAEIRAELSAAMQEVKDKVFLGDVDGLEDLYMPDCKYVFDDMLAVGWVEIKAHLTSAIGGGGKVFIYTNLEWYLASETRAVKVGGEFDLSGWTGKFIFEDWYRQPDGRWKILNVLLKSDS